MYELIFDEEAIKYLEKLPQQTSKRIFKKLNNAKKEPHRYFERLTNRKEYKLRVGEYRLIADITKSKLIIYIITIGHRKNIYKKL